MMRGWILMIKSILEQKVKVKAGVRSISCPTKLRLIAEVLRKDENIEYAISFKSSFYDDGHVFAVEYVKGTKSKLMKKLKNDFEVFEKSYLPDRMYNIFAFDSKYIVVLVPKTRIF